MSAPRIVIRNTRTRVQVVAGGRISTGTGGVSDGDKGDVTVSASGATWTVDAVGGQTAAAIASHVAVAHQPLDGDLTAIAALSTTGWAQRTGANTWALSTPTAADVGALTQAEADTLYDVLGSAADAESNANTYTDTAVAAKQDQDPVLDALVLVSGSGILTQSAPGTFNLRTIATSGAGLSISNAGGVAGDPTISLSGDVAAIEALSGTGWAQRTGSNTWTLSTPTYTDVGADAAGTAAGLIATHEAAGDPHPGYLTEAAAASTYVVGPASATDNALVRWDATTGRLVQDSTWVLNDSGTVTMTGTSGSQHSLIVSSSNSGIELRGNRSSGNTSADAVVRGQAARGMTSALFDVQNNATLAFRVRGDGAVLPAQIAATSGIAQALVSGGVNYTGQTASTEAPHWHANTYTRTWATGALATQREVRIDAPTYAFAGASTITDAATLYVGASPIAGTNATITNAYALWVDSGTSRFDGAVQIPNTGLQVYDTDSSHFLTLAPGSNLTAARTLTLTTGDASRTVDLTGSQGAIYYTDASGNLVPLAPGTDGDVLTTHGAAAPTWETPAGGGGGGGGLTQAQILARTSLRL